MVFGDIKLRQNALHSHGMIISVALITMRITLVWSITAQA